MVTLYYQGQNDNATCMQRLTCSDFQGLSLLKTQKLVWPREFSPETKSWMRSDGMVTLRNLVLA